MDEKLIKKVILPSCVMIILCVTFFHEIRHCIDTLIFKDKHLLIVGILSAPGNFEQRQSIRKTWLKLTSEISVNYYFFIGSEICNIHPIDRSDPYSCTEAKIALPRGTTSQTEFHTAKVDIKKLHYTTQEFMDGVSGFGFRTTNSIIITKLGIFKYLLQQMQTEVRLLLKSSFDNAVLASVTFSPVLLLENNASSENFVMKAIQPIHLPKNVEARLVVDLLNNRLPSVQSCKPLVWDEGPGLISFIQLIIEPQTKPWPFTNLSCPNVAMTYKVSDLKELLNLTITKNNRVNEWKQSNRKLVFNLKNEQEQYGDLMFVDVVDVYSNLPNKVIQFFKKIVSREYFHYILKTDDDTFIDILRVYKQLENVDLTLEKEIQNQLEKDYWSTGAVARIRMSKLWWWSNVRENWKVQDAGKWRDDIYRSPAYPAFPCGGGYVLSKGIVDYIIANSNRLQTFQGEDVSIGIWLAALSTIRFRTKQSHIEEENRIQEEVISKYGAKTSWYESLMTKKCPGVKFDCDFCDWWCDFTTENKLPFCNKGQLNVEQMYKTWESFVAQGSLG